ncbi:hypothetical protein D3C78_1936060 [compost metagenome]
MVGIDLFVLKAISSVIQSKEESLQDLLANLPEPSVSSQKYASVFPDGSIFGLIDIHPVRFETVVL